jgi:hypothetical protein
MIKRSRLIILLALVVVSAPTFAKEYDVVLLNGRVMDPETNLDAIRNVGFLDGRIAKITKRDITLSSMVFCEKR